MKFAFIALGAGVVNARLTHLHAAQEKVPYSFNKLPCDELVTKAEVKFPQDLLIGERGNFDMYSGYINVTPEDYLFYWLAEAESGASKDAPLIVWSNGGPGCSAMEGATTEHGPYVLYGAKDNPSAFSAKLTKNPYSWNRRAHVLYVDQPRYVGYSIGTGDHVTTSRDAGLDMVTFLKNWRKVFPEHAHRDIIISSESYGGHYAPAWAGAIVDYNDGAGKHDKLPLSGVVIGNGIMNVTTQGDAEFVEWARTEGIIPETAQVTSENQARNLAEKTLGYIPNFYDWRIQDLSPSDCCGCDSYNYTSWAHWLARPDVAKALNVCGNAGDKAFADCNAGCISLPSFDEDDTFLYNEALEKTLSHGIPVVFFYGKQDTACNYVGGYRVANDLRWPGVSEFAKAKKKDLQLGRTVGGKIRSGGNLTWIEIDAAGHMVPLNHPAAGYAIIDTLLKNYEQSGLTLV